MKIYLQRLCRWNFLESALQFEISCAPFPFLPSPLTELRLQESRSYPACSRPPASLVLLFHMIFMCVGAVVPCLDLLCAAFKITNQEKMGKDNDLFIFSFWGFYTLKFDIC